MEEEVGVETLTVGGGELSLFDVDSSTSNDNGEVFVVIVDMFSHCARYLKVVCVEVLRVVVWCSCR